MSVSPEKKRKIRDSGVIDRLGLRQKQLQEAVVEMKTVAETIAATNQNTNQATRRKSTSTEFTLNKPVHA